MLYQSVFTSLYSSTPTDSFIVGGGWGGEGGGEGGNNMQSRN